MGVQGLVNMRTLSCRRSLDIPASFFTGTDALELGPRSVTIQPVLQVWLPRQNLQSNEFGYAVLMCANSGHEPYKCCVVRSLSCVLLFGIHRHGKVIMAPGWQNKKIEMLTHQTEANKYTDTPKI